MPRDLHVVSWNRGVVRRRWALASNQVALPCCATVTRVAAYSNESQARRCGECGQGWLVIAADQQHPPQVGEVSDGSFRCWPAGPACQQLTFNDPACA